MSDEAPKRSGRRRRRRPRRGGDKPREEQTSASKAETPAPGETSSDRGRRSRGRRDRGRRDEGRRSQRPSGERTEPVQRRDRAAELRVQRHDADSLEVSPINEDTFIYTYTLRPRSLLDNYRPSDPVTKRMKFEGNPDDAS